MRKKNLFELMLDVEHVVLDRVEYDHTAAAVIVHVRPDGRWAKRDSCGRCGAKCSRYDRGEGRRRWRTLDLGEVMAYLEAEAPRVWCPAHGAVVAAVPWARHDARVTRRFEDTVAWLTTQCSQTAVAKLMRVAWRTVVRISERVLAEAQGGQDRLDGLRRLGIDEFALRKGLQDYLTVVVDHDTRRLVWAAPGRDAATVKAFFDELGPERCVDIEAVTADAAGWIRSGVKARCGQAALCMDPFHVVAWATEALDEVRRKAWNAERRADNKAQAKALKGCRHVLGKNPQELTPAQQQELAAIEQAGGPLWAAYELKEQLRRVFQLEPRDAHLALDAWLADAKASHLQPFVKVAHSVERHRKAIEQSIHLGLSNGLAESTNTKLRVILRRAFGFHYVESFIASAMLSLGGLCPPLRAQA